MKLYKLPQTKKQILKLFSIIELIEKAHNRMNDAKAILYSYDNAKDEFATVRLFANRDELIKDIDRYNSVINRLNLYYRNQLNEL